jgi:hypothetical protein
MVNEALIRYWLRGHQASERWQTYYYLSGCVIGWCLGPAWLQRQIMADANPTAFFQNNSAPGEHRCHFVARIGFLADLIYNLQAVENFEERLKHVRCANGDGIEAGIVELAAGRFFKSNDILFRFVKESGVKGQDYDIEYVTTDGRLGRCEVECKLQSKDLNANGIANSLKHAKGQLPKGTGAGIVMLRIPEEWWTTDAITTSINAVSASVEAFFAKEKTSRLSSVLCVQHRNVIYDGNMQQYLLCKEYENPYCSVRSGLPGLREVAPPRSSWMPLLAFID